MLCQWLPGTPPPPSPSWSPTTDGLSLDVHSKSSLFNEHLAATDYYNASSEINRATDVPYGFFHHPLPGQRILSFPQLCILDRIKLLSPPPSRSATFVKFRTAVYCIDWVHPFPRLLFLIYSGPSVHVLIQYQ